MIIKGRARGRARELAEHLLRDENEDVQLYELRGVTASDVQGALAEMEALAAAVPSKRPLYHASISPEAHTPLTRDQIRLAADTLERKLGLAGQPRVIVCHRKRGREHVHIVWSRIDLERQQLISDAWNYRAHEEAARELEAEFGHRTIQGAHVPAPGGRRRHRPEEYEFRQAGRSGRTAHEVGAELSALWHRSQNGAAFRMKLEAAGYRLARGDRRVFVVVDQAGNAHSLSRRLGIRTEALRTRLRDLDLEALPSVREAREALHSRREGSLLPMSYRETAKEITQASRTARRLTATPLAAPAFLAAVRWINGGHDRPQPIAQLPATRFITLARLRALRVAILADFAAKMDEAVARLTDDELLAALKRLADERDAALRALERIDGRDRAVRRETRRRRPRRRYAMRRLR